MILAETLEQAQKQRDADENYCKKWDHYDGDKESFKNTYFGKFTPPEIEWNTQSKECVIKPDVKLSAEELEKNDKIEELKESPDYPIIERMISEGLIGNEILDKLIDSVWADGKINLDLLDVNNDGWEEKELIKIAFESKENSKENLSNFIEDAGDIPELSGMKEIYDTESTVENGTRWLDTALFEKIWGNYFSLNSNAEIQNKWADISMAIEITAKEIIQEFGNNINTESETYKTALAYIDGGDLEQQIKGIESLYFLAQMWNAVSGAKMEQTKALMVKGNKLFKNIMNEIHELKTELWIATKEWKEQKIKNLEEELVVLEEMKDEFSSWDIFPAGTLDVLHNNLSEGKQGK